MLNVGITGGIGVGKTTVCKIFEILGIPIYYADDRAKRLMTGNKYVKKRIIQLFGNQAYFLNGRLNRKYIGNKIFQDKLLLEKMNSIVHPAVFQDATEWLQRQKNVPYVLQEAALLVESGRYKLFDKLIVVTAPTELKIARVMKRDRKTESEIESIISKQLPDIKKIEKADYLIHNDGKQSLIHQVMAIHQAISPTTAMSRN